MIFLVIILLIYATILTIKSIKSKKQQNRIETPTEEIEIKTGTEQIPYLKKLLLTKNEWSFYKSLKPIADELKLTVLSKIRVADMVEPIPSNNQSEWQKYFNKINRKHVDFALAKPENLQIMLLIELDDSSHDDDQKQRDEFIEALYAQTGYNFIRVRGSGELKEKIQNALIKNKKTPN